MHDYRYDASGVYDCLAEAVFTRLSVLRLFAKQTNKLTGNKRI